MINTPSGRSARADGYEIRTATVAADKPIFTTIAQLGAAVASFEAIREGFEVTSLQEYDRRAAGSCLTSESAQTSARACRRRSTASATSASASTRTPRCSAPGTCRTRAEGAREFGLRCVDAAAGRIGIVKPQVAFYERHGAAGYAALEDVLRAARDAGLIVIADVKRGDIGSTVGAYGEAWLTPGSPLEADAMTVVAYQGVGSLEDPIGRARAYGKGLFVLGGHH